MTLSLLVFFFISENLIALINREKKLFKLQNSEISNEFENGTNQIDSLIMHLYQIFFFPFSFKRLALIIVPIIMAFLSVY